MSLLRQIARGALKVEKVGAKILKGGTPAAAMGIAAAGLLGGLKRSAPLLPGIGTAAVVGEVAWDVAHTGKEKKKKHRKKGISAHDLKSFKRVARLINHFAAPVHHLKKSSYTNKKGI